MTVRRSSLTAWLFLGLLLLGRDLRGAELYLNEILFNPPGADTNSEYIEIRGQPNAILPPGTWFVAVEGDALANPGTVQNTIDLSRRALGQNGFLVLLQKLTRYKPHPYCVALTNAGAGDGWGSGSSSSVRHRGEGGQTELENPSCTFFLIQTAVDPRIGDDIDSDNDGIPDGPIPAAWTVLDSIGIVDSDAATDTVYGRINFRRATGEPSLTLPPTTGPVITVPFTPGYVGRNGNSTGWSENDWVAGDNLLGRPPKWKLDRNSRTATNTFPAARSGAQLGHVGAPNFAAPVLPGVLIRETGGSTKITKGGKADSYFVSLSRKPAGPVTVRATASPPLLISADGRNFAGQVEVVLTSTKSRRITTRAFDDGAVGPSLRSVVLHSIVATSDPTNYPESSLILPVSVALTDPSVVLLSEAKVNPPGTNDGPFEYIELLGPPNQTITNIYVLAVPGNTSGAPGRTDLAFNLSGRRFGPNGHLILAAPDHPYAFNPGSTVVPVPAFSMPAGALDNGTLSLLLVGSWSLIPQGVDLDAGDNGTLEGLPADAVILDAVAWKDRDIGDVLYGGVEISQKGFTPDAVSRVPGNRTPNSAAAWMAGNLAGTNGDSLIFDGVHVSTNLPPGSQLTPGFVNATAPSISPNPLAPLSHVLGDPGNPDVPFAVLDDETPVNSLQVSVTSTNPLVVPDSNLALVRAPGGRWTLRLSAIGVGYSDIRITVSDGTYTGRATLHFAASAPGRPGALWHTGVSDASTAIPIDAKWMWVGDDENQTLRIYSRTQSGGPVAALDFNPFLGLVDFYNNNPATPKEVDIEASTRAGSRIFWLGSHSHSADTNERTNRARLFATDMSGSGTNSRLAFAGRYDYLKIDLLAWDAANLHGKGSNYYGFAASSAVGVDPKAPDGSGFNIEGLCLAPGSVTEGFLAFRAPLVPPDRACALIVSVTNFADLAVSGGAPGSARFGPPIELNLGGRGIRSIEGLGANYLIVAGPAGAGTNLPPPGDFRFFTWTGRPTDAPQERTGDLSGLNVEGIVDLPSGSWSATTKIQLVTDAGTNVYYGDGIPAKHLPVPEFKKFRTDTVELGGFGSTPAAIRAMRLTPAGLRIEWLSTEHVQYRLQRRSALGAAWIDEGLSVTATDPISAITVPVDATQSFFRIVTISPANAELDR